MALEPAIQPAITPDRVIFCARIPGVESLLSGAWWNTTPVREIRRTRVVRGFKLLALTQERTMPIYSTHLFRHFRFLIGRNIRQFRVEQNMPIGALADLSGVPGRKILHYERGKCGINLEELFHIACALEIGMGHLVK